MRRIYQFHYRHKQVGHLEQQCKNNAIYSSKFDSCYFLTKDINGVKYKFIGAPIVGPNRKAIWVPKNIVTNLGEPKKVWVSK